MFPKKKSTKNKANDNAFVIEFRISTRVAKGVFASGPLQLDSVSVIKLLPNKLSKGELKSFASKALGVAV